MKIQFYKYHGTGNDFILIDDRPSKVVMSTNEIKLLCDRHFGIGADGLIRIVAHKEFDFEMIYYNSDGKLGSMCGNGGRCAIAFANKLKLINDKAKFLAADGPHLAEIIDSSPMIIKLKMSDVASVSTIENSFLIDTGSPHFVQFVDDLDNLDVVKEGRKIRNSDRFVKEGVNVNFVKFINGELHIRTYERGVEDETLSCGTGITASVLVASFAQKIGTVNVLSVVTPGGNLKVHFHNNQQSFTDIWLEGPAEAVFEGELNFGT